MMLLSRMKMFYSFFGVVFTQVYAVVKTHKIEKNLLHFIFLNYASIALFSREI